MRKHPVLLFVLLIACAVAANAQITVQRNGLMQIGDTYTIYYTTGTTPVAVGPSGANRAWTLPAFTWGGTILGHLVDPQFSIYGDSFPEATLCDIRVNQSNPAAPSFYYYRRTDSAFFSMGIAFSLSDIRVYNPAGLFFPLPCSEQSSWTRTLRTTFSDRTDIDSSLHFVDGWGTLQTQYGNYSCLRVFVYVYQISRPNTGTPTTHQYVGYYWLLQNGMWVAYVTSALDNVDPNFTAGYVQIKNLTLSAEPTGDPLVHRFSLAQNYPNPFNPQTEIAYTLPRNQAVSLKVFDLLGREVTTLFSGTQTAGEHRASFNGRDLPSGVYVYRLEVGEISQTRKMLLLK
jgi:hypothetical protein